MPGCFFSTELSLMFVLQGENIKGLAFNMNLFIIIIASIFISCDPHHKQWDSCLKITCLNPRDTVSQKDKQIKTYFLIESLGGTIKVKQVLSSCGCEYPTWRKNMIIYPNKPDTIVITSLLTGRHGAWKKQHTILTDKCSMIFYTGYWWVKN